MRSILISISCLLLATVAVVLVYRLDGRGAMSVARHESTELAPTPIRPLSLPKGDCNEPAELAPAPVSFAMCQ
jgi:hypothetical protein